jgi:selenocysteine lyase/cysteine desulfurase
MSSAPLPVPQATIDWAEVRARYPAALTAPFLNGGSRGLLSRAAHEAGLASLSADFAMRPDQPPADWQLNEVRGLFGRLVNAEPHSVAVTLNVSHGLNMIATALDWQAGDELITCSDIEHANNVYVWEALRAKGVVVRDIPSRNGALDADAVIAAMTAATRLVTVSAVSFVPGFRADLKAIGTAARERDALFLVDAVQACGVLNLDVQDEAVDALATSTSKGLLGIRGLGFLYVSPRWIERLRPAMISRTSIDTAGKHYSEFEGASFTFKRDARRFECGNYNYVGIAIARVALQELIGLGSFAIEARAKAMAAQLRDGLAAQGWPVMYAPTPVQDTHLVTLGTRGEGGPAETGNPALDGFARALDAAGVRFSIRRRLIRFGFHMYNDETDVNAVLDIAARARASFGQRRTA